MLATISPRTMTELFEALRQRYLQAAEPDKAKILDEFAAVAGCHRKHAIRLLNRAQGAAPLAPPAARRTCDEAVREALVVPWEAADRIRGKRLKMILPRLLQALEQHGRLALDAGVRERLLAASPAALDRLPASVRGAASTRKRRRRATKSSKQVPVRTFADWNGPQPGFLETAFAAHGGASMHGTFLLRAERERFDPLELLHPIRQAQAALATLASGESGGGPGRESLEQFLAKLPEMWRDGVVRPAHRREAPQNRTWRTREGPFEGVWPELLLRLQAEPEAAAQSLLKRLQQKHPGRFPEGQVRTLQRRLRERRRVLARQLAYSCLGGTTAGAGMVVIGRNGSANLAERSDAGAGAAPGGDGQRASGLRRGTEAAAQGLTNSNEQMSEARGARLTPGVPNQSKGREPQALPGKR